MILMVTLRIHDVAVDLSIVVGVLSMFTMPVLVHTMRAHFRSIDMVQQQTKQFSVLQCASSCCQKGHDGNDICDRDIILQCIISWYGSVQDFEHHVRTEVQTALTYHLGHEVYSFPRVLSATEPVFWMYLDWSLSRQTNDRSIAGVLGGLAYWFAVLPCVCTG